MRLLVTLLFLAPLFAQQPPPPGGARPPRPAPKNLKLLEPANLMAVMHSYESALGVKCAHCHVQGDFASDEKPQKETARKMIVMAREINAKYFAGHEGGAEPGSEHAHMHVTCYTCHHGSVEPMTAAAAAPATAPAAHPPAEK